VEWENFGVASPVKNKSKRRKSRSSLIGVIHLPALPGAPGAFALSADAALDRAGERALKEARAFAQAGFDSIILENFGDVPFYADQVPTETAVALGILATAVRDYVSIPVGLNVLRNDALTSLKIAAMTGLSFIRVNVLSGIYATDQGLITGRAAELLRLRESWNASHIQIMADVLVKHAQPISTASLELAAEEAVLRGGASGFVVSGETTGRAVGESVLEKASAVSAHLGVPFYVGSGATESQLPALKRAGAGIIVSSALREGKRAGAPLNPRALRDFVKKFKSA